jgi:hypothetical protein
MLKRIVVKNGKEDRQKGARKEPTRKRSTGTLKKQEREASQESRPIIRGVQKAGVHRSKTVGRTLVLEPQLRTVKRGQLGVTVQDFKEQNNIKRHELCTDGLKVKGSSCTNKLSETSESIKPAKGFLDSPQEHSLASLLKRRSLVSSRRQVYNLIRLTKLDTTIKSSYL